MRTDLCGSCELAQRVRGAAQSTTARSSRLAAAGRATGRLGAHSVCQCPMGTGRRPRPSRFPNGRAIRQHPRSQPAHSSVERRARCPPRELSLAARMHWRTQRKAAPIRRDTRAQRACRAARAHGSVRACEWHGERSNRPALSRPTGCGRAVVVAPVRAAIRARVRFARRLGTAWRRPLSAGLHAAPSPQAASFGRGGGVTGCAGRKSHPLSTPLVAGVGVGG